MIDSIKNLSKAILSPLGIFLSHNQRYDWQLKKVIEQLQADKNDIALIDVGAHKGEVTDLAMQYHTDSQYLLFEPIPVLFERLQKQYTPKNNVNVYNIGLAEKKSTSTFQYNHTNPAYSGIRRREYPSEQDQVEEIMIQLDTLDSIIEQINPNGISLIKIDVEGAELGVLLGAKETIKNYKPLVVFEHGLGASEFYNTKPENIFEFFSALNMSIQTMEDWLNKKAAGFTQEAFEEQFHNKLNYYFIAYHNS